MKTKVIIFGKEKEKIFDSVAKLGFEIVEKNPDFVISYGGDGTVMHSEAAYPGIPKIILRNSRICKLCSCFSNDEVLEKVKSGKYEVEEYWKIQCEAKGKELLATNEITVHNSDPRHAILYKFSIDGKSIGHEIKGDGVVVATPLGSTGYYRSITDSFFEVGIGLAFNNSIEEADHMVLKEDSIIKLEITRGPAAIFADNQEEIIMLDVGDTVTFQKSSKITKIVKVI